MKRNREQAKATHKRKTEKRQKNRYTVAATATEGTGADYFMVRMGESRVWVEESVAQSLLLMAVFICPQWHLCQPKRKKRDK